MNCNTKDFATINVCNGVTHQANLVKRKYVSLNLGRKKNPTHCPSYMTRQFLFHFFLFCFVCT